MIGRNPWKYFTPMKCSKIFAQCLTTVFLSLPQKVPQSQSRREGAQRWTQNWCYVEKEPDGQPSESPSVTHIFYALIELYWTTRKLLYFSFSCISIISVKFMLNFFSLWSHRHCWDDIEEHCNVEQQPKKRRCSSVVGGFCATSQVEWNIGRTCWRIGWFFLYLPASVTCAWKKNQAPGWVKNSCQRRDFHGKMVVFLEG